MAVQIIVGYLRLFDRVLKQYQIDIHMLVVTVGVIQRYYAYLEDDEQNSFTLDEYVMLLNALQQRFERPVALVMADQVALPDIGLVGYLTSTSFDLQQAFQLLIAYYPLLYKQTNNDVLEVFSQDASVKIQWNAINACWQNFYELNQALLYKYTNLIVQDELIPPDYVALGYPSHFALAHYQKFFNCPIQTISHHYILQFPQSILATRSKTTDAQLNQLFSLQAQKKMHADNGLTIKQRQLKQKIFRLLECAFRQELPLQQFIAAELHCSERTLQRQLKKNTMNFSAIVDEYRCERSTYYLAQGKSLMEIAELLNYADQSAFGRAFKRWTGYPPRQYAKHQQIQSGLIL